MILMDNEFEEKLRSFKSVVLREAKTKGEKKLDKTMKKTNDTMEKNETEYLSEAYEKIQNKIRSIRREDNEKVLQADIEARRKLLKAREEIVNKVFNEAKGKLLEFKATDEYSAWLKSKIGNAVSELGEGKLSAMFSADDRAAAEKIADSYPDVKFIFEDTDEIGGVRIYNEDKKTAVDYRFSELLAAQRAEFLHVGGLTINE